jgi:FixJ family two-component response regulator
MPLRRGNRGEGYRKSNYPVSGGPLLPMVAEAGGPSMDNPRARIAILDDDPSVRTALARLLRTSQLTAIPFTTCLELLNYLDSDSVDCLVLDLQMPGMNGIDVMRYLAARGVDLPVVIITAHDGAGARESCLLAGASSYLPKPIDAVTLLQAIEDAIDSRRITS